MGRTPPRKTNGRELPPGYLQPFVRRTPWHLGTKCHSQTPGGLGLRCLGGSRRGRPVYHSGVRGQNSPGCDRTDRHFLSQDRAGLLAPPNPMPRTRVGPEQPGFPSTIRAEQGAGSGVWSLRCAFQLHCNRVIFGKLPSSVGLTCSICKLKPTSHGEDCAW